MPIKKLYTLCTVMLIVALSTAVHAVSTSKAIGALSKAHSGQEALEESEALMKTGDQQGAQEKSLEAQKFFNEAVLICQKLSPEKLDLASVKDYANAMDTVGEYDLAARGYTRGYALDPSAVNMALGAGRNWRKVGEAYFERAIPPLLDILSLNEIEPSIQSQAHSELGRIYQAQGLYTLAGEAYTSGLELDAKNIDAIIGNALITIQQGKLTEANQLLASAQELTPEQTAFLQAGLAKALTVMESNHIKIAETADTHYAYAMFLVRTQRLYESLLAVEHAVMLDDSNFAMYNLRGGLLMQQGLEDRAKASYVRSLVLNPDQPKTRKILADL